MQELGPLLIPPDNMPLEHTGLQRFKQYFEALAHALLACQADEAALHAPAAAHPAHVASDGFHWSCLTVPAGNVLMLVATLAQQLPMTACCEVTAQFLETFLKHCTTAEQMSHAL